MLSAIAAVVLVVGTVSATVSVTQNDKHLGEQAAEPMDQVQSVERPESPFG